MKPDGLQRIVAIGLALSLVGVAAALADDGGRLYLTVDKTQIISFASATVTKIAVTNPAIADVNVISPAQILISGKTVGQTSLLVFQSGRVEHFDVIVHPVPTTTPRAALVPSAEHGVEVLRGGKVSHQLFVRDTNQTWVQLGLPAVEPEVTKK